MIISFKIVLHFCLQLCNTCYIFSSIDMCHLAVVMVEFVFTFKTAICKAISVCTQYRSH